jgi:hypothetical protein
VPLALGTPHTGATTGYCEPEATSARSHTLTINDAIKGRREGIVMHAVDQRTARTDEAGLLTPRHPFSGQNRNRRRGSGVNKQSTPCAYWEDANKKNQGWALLDEGTASPMPDGDDPAIMATMAPGAGEDGRTYKTLSK